jgi:hypothetical protein
MDRDYTYRIIGCIYEVYNQLGPGLLESIYEKAMIKELRMQLYTYLRLMNCELGYVVNFNTENIRESIYPVVNNKFIKSKGFMIKGNSASSAPDSFKSNAEHKILKSQNP